MKQELTTSIQIVEEEQKYKRECKGGSLALTKNVYRLVNTDVFYVESESSNNTYYFVKFKPDVLEWCSCPDNSMRGVQIRCKHIWSIEFAIRMGTLRDTDRLPTEAKVRNVVVTTITPAISKSYTNDDYSFWFFLKKEVLVTKLKIIRSTTDKNKKLFTIQYTKKELDKIQSDILQQIKKYFPDKVETRKEERVNYY
jgi:hypothetical protein